MSFRHEKCPTRCEGTLNTHRNTLIRLTTLFLWKTTEGRQEPHGFYLFFFLFSSYTAKIYLNSRHMRDEIKLFSSGRETSFFFFVNSTLWSLHCTSMREYLRPITPAASTLPMSTLHANWPCRHVRLFTCLAAFCTKKHFEILWICDRNGTHVHTELRDYISDVPTIPLAAASHTQVNNNNYCYLLTCWFKNLTANHKGQSRRKRNEQTRK